MQNCRLSLARRVTRILGAGAACALLGAGCSEPRGPLSVKSDDPDLKIPAIKQDVQQRRTQDLAQMVSDLDNEDPAVRFYAIEGLRRLTGRTFEYHYFDDENNRRPAVNRWKEWLKQQRK